MDQNIITLLLAIVALLIGCGIGYYIRQSLAKKRAGSLEAKLQKKVIQVKEETADLVKKAESKASEITEKAQKDIDQRRSDFLKAEQVLLDREKILDGKIGAFDAKELDFQGKVEKLKKIKEQVDVLRTDAETKLEKVANLTREDAKKELLALVETDYRKRNCRANEKNGRNGQRNA